MSIVAVTQLSIAYPGSMATLREISFDIESGERVALMGPNGAGKTTLLLGMAGALKTQAGMVNIAGLDPAVPAQRRQLPTKLGLAFQNPDDQILHPVVCEDVAFGPLNLGLPLEDVRRRVAVALGQVGLGHRSDDVPWKLSAGEKRRTALAGVLAMQPEVLLLDEPTSGLDPGGRRAMAELLRSLEKTLLVATHDLGFVRAVCDRIIVLDRGAVVADRRAGLILDDLELLKLHGLDDGL